MKKKTFKSEESWLRGRRQLLGSSDAPSIAGLFEEGGFGDDRYTLWARKTGKLPDTQSILRFEVGHFLEDFIASKAAEWLDTKVVDPGDYTIFLSEENEWLGSTIDREPPDLEGILELKTVSSSQKKDWKQSPNLYTRIQVVHQNLTIGRAATWVAGLIGLGEELVIHEVEVTDSQIDLLHELEYDFWHKHVKPDIPPPIGRGERSKETLKALFPESIELSSVDLPATPELLTAARMFWWRQEQQKPLKGALRAVEKDLVQYENMLKAEMGDAETGELPGVTYSWKSSPREGYTVEPTTVRPFKEVKK
jgi:predicted phage-related endonuclease